MMESRTTIEAMLRRDCMVVLGGLIVVSALAWAYTIQLVGDMAHSGVAHCALPRTEPWGAVDFFLTFVMWTVMMVAMMLPSAAPMILMFALVNRRRQEQRGPYVSAGVFLVGYLVVWTGYSAAAALAQWGLHSVALLSPRMVSTSPVLGGALLMSAGIFQWTSLKQACLTQCRSPLDFFTTHWQEGTRGALMMGLQHGSFCVGCCWILMLVLFVVGVMSLLWMAVITAFVLIEKVAPPNRWVGRASGWLLIAWGVWMAASVWF